MDGRLNSEMPTPVLPGGTVTFLFTDIEGSTRLLQRLGDQYSELLADQRRILRAAFKKWDGQEVDTQGDSFFVSFPLATDAIAAVVEIQRSMADHTWPEGTSVRLRMGLHTGEPRLAEEGYVGIDVHRAARIGSIGHGGQVLLSETTAALVYDELPEGVKLLDLGEHRLKDIHRPEPISQLVISGLLSDFPTLKSLDARPNNLPTQPTPFIGRQVELDALGEMISDPEIRLVTILGAGGMGKTRLALALAEEQLLATKSTNGTEAPRFPNGVFFVPLAPVDSTDRLLSAISKAVSFQFYEGVEPKKQLLDYFREKDTMLIMDNFEHLLDGAEVLAEILETAPLVKALATSREKLNLRGETVYSLQGMSFPTNGFEADITPPQIEDEYSALNLFVLSARRMHPGIEFTLDDMRDVALICQLVDGMPLGVELAAAWVEMLSPKEIAAEIQDNLDFLEAQRRDAPERHQSIRAVFDYTWKMVGDEEREVFEKLSIFQGGFTREAAENVTGASLKVLKVLSNKSLIQQARDGRYTIHELLRQYAEEKLSRDPEKVDQLRDRHSEYFAAFVHQREAAIRGGDQAETLTDMDNIRSGWKWAVTREKTPEIRKQMQSLWWLHEFQGWFQEAVVIFEWGASVLRTDAPVGDKGIAYGQVLHLLGAFSERTGQSEEGTHFIRKGRAILRKLDARLELAWTNVALGHFGKPMDYTEAVQYFQESLAIYEEMDLAWGIANVHNCWATRAMSSGRYEKAEHHYQEAIQINSDLNDRRGMAWSLSGLGRVALSRSDYLTAKKYFEESLHIFKAIDYKLLIWILLKSLGEAEHLMGEFEEAQARHQDALDVSKGMGFEEGIAISIADLGTIALSTGEYELAKEHYQEALGRLQSLGDQDDVGMVFGYLGNVSVALGDYGEARINYHSAMEIGAASHNASLCLSVLAGSAAMYEPVGNAARAVALATVAQSHPQADPFTRERAKKLLDELSAKLPPEIFTEAQERGKALDLWETVDELLGELGA